MDLDDRYYVHVQTLPTPNPSADCLIFEFKFLFAAIIPLGCKCDYAWSAEWHPLAATHATVHGPKRIRRSSGGCGSPTVPLRAQPWTGSGRPLHGTHSRHAPVLRRRPLGLPAGHHSTAGLAAATSPDPVTRHR